MVWGTGGVPGSIASVLCISSPDTKKSFKSRILKKLLTLKKTINTKYNQRSFYTDDLTLPEMN